MRVAPEFVHGRHGDAFAVLANLLHVIEGAPDLGAAIVHAKHKARHSGIEIVHLLAFGRRFKLGHTLFGEALFGHLARPVLTRK
jgi:hypothetical protein